ncbi:MAG: hypothetical protein ABFS35_18700 [Bacteroidota bacterium]
MKTKLILIAVAMVLFVTGCDKNEPSINEKINISSISFTDCNTNTKLMDNNAPSVRLIGQPGGTLLIKLVNTEFCCGTDSISLRKNFNDNKISIEIIDNGPFTYCYCPHDLEFTIDNLENVDYELSLIESEHAYSRNTFLIHFKYSQQLDTTVTEFIPENNLLSNNPFDYIKTDLGGCNGLFKSAEISNELEIDTIIFSRQADTLKIFTGLNLTCCIDFGTESEIIGDTLIMRINTLNDDFCDCICYYTFDYFYTNFEEQGFYYQFYIDEFKRFEGKHNLPYLKYE